MVDVDVVDPVATGLERGRVGSPRRNTSRST
jgi:hypothetical protein